MRPHKVHPLRQLVMEKSPLGVRKTGMEKQSYFSMVEPIARYMATSHAIRKAKK